MCASLLDLWSGVPARLRHPVACAAGSDHRACHSAIHYVAFLSREPSVPAYHP